MSIDIYTATHLRYTGKYRAIKEELCETTGYPRKFIESKHGYCRTTDDWYPSFKGREHKYVAFYVVPIGMMHSKLPFARFMGADDSDMGREFSSDQEMFDFFDVLPEIVNRDFLEAQGFVAGY